MKDRLIALRDELLKKMRAIEGQIAGLDLAISILDQEDAQFSLAQSATPNQNASEQNPAKSATDT